MNNKILLILLASVLIGIGESVLFWTYSIGAFYFSNGNWTLFFNLYGENLTEMILILPTYLIIQFIAFYFIIKEIREVKT